VKTYYVYILTNKSNTLYTGVSNSLDRRLLEHEFKINKKSFAAKYNINKLIYCQEFSNPEDAIAAEKKIKGWTRKKKMDLIKTINPEFKDLGN
jgi:putative endonuclease